MKTIQSNLRKFLLIVKPFAKSLNKRRVAATLCGAVILGITLVDAMGSTEKRDNTQTYSFAAGSLITEINPLTTAVDAVTTTENISIVQVAAVKSLVAPQLETVADDAKDPAVSESQAEVKTKTSETTKSSGEKETEKAKTTKTTKKTETKKDDTQAAETKAATNTETATPKTVISYTDEDYNNLLRIVEAEVTGGDLKSKIIVADVIINRVKHPHFPKTVTEVIYQGNGEQFQPIADGRFYSVNVTSSTVEAVNRALHGEDYSQGAFYFASLASVNAGCWHVTHLTRLFEYGGHVYFTF